MSQPGEETRRDAATYLVCEITWSAGDGMYRAEWPSAYMQAAPDFDSLLDQMRKSLLETAAQELMRTPRDRDRRVPATRQ